MEDTEHDYRSWKNPWKLTAIGMALVIATVPWIRSADRERPAQFSFVRTASQDLKISSGDVALVRGPVRILSFDKSKSDPPRN